ncbi:MAG TPA: hypothetical protein VKE26_07090 [Xanthobacteraceae bacterium]|jgi:hypothetical protein|nr:hypothetical protein [Xanthobacteraceae bacterium]
MLKTMSCIVAVVAIAMSSAASAQAPGGRATVAPGAAASGVNPGGMSPGGIGPGGTLIAPGLAPTGANIDQIESGVPLAPGPAGQFQPPTTPRMRPQRR